MQLIEAVAEPEARVFHTLDALRGIAALGVVTFHMAQVFTPITAAGGYLAVDLFFMMSGVVLSHAYESRFRAGMGVLDFMRVRLIRLYPLYLLGTLFGIAVTLASMFGRNIQHWEASTLLHATLLALLFLPNLSGRPINEMFPLNIPCWSLFLELVVNLLFVISWPVLSSRRLIGISLLTGGAVGMAIIYGGNADQGSTTSSIAIGLARTLFGFSIGVLIARHVRRSPRAVSNTRFFAILAIVGVAIAARPHGEWRMVWDGVCVLAIFPLVVYWGTLIDPSPALQKVASFLGLTSYAVYVLHTPFSSVLNSMTRRFVASGGKLAAPYLGLAALVLLLAGCWMIDRYFDMPLRRRLGLIIRKLS